MKKIILLCAISALAFSACKKKKPSAVGFWQANNVAALSEGGGTFKGAYSLKADGSAIYYGYNPNSTDTSNLSWKGIGTWKISGLNVTIDFLDPISNHTYQTKGVSNEAFTSMTGTFAVDVIADNATFTATK